MKVLITGGTGLLGQALLGGTTPSGVELSATYCSESSPGKTTVRFYRLDVTDSERGNVVAASQASGCENSPEKSRQDRHCDNLLFSTAHGRSLDQICRFLTSARAEIT